LKKRESIIVLAVTAFLFLLICGLLSLAGVGSGITLWLNSGQAASEGVTSRPTRIMALAESSPAPTFSPTPTVTLIPSGTPTPPPTDTSTPTSVPPSPTATHVLPTETPTSKATPTDTPPPQPTATDTPTPIPSFAFEILEFEKFPTNHLNFDVYIAITDGSNNPLSGYRMIGQHGGGMQVDSEASASRWTQNSGAMHYKAGNIKFEVFNSPGGVWVLQLVDQAGQPVAPPLEFPFDPANPAWYFVLLQQR
jgi:hypothetical protein